MSETGKLEAPDDGKVLVTTSPRVTEKEIAEDRDIIVLRLHSAYLNLVDHMAEFQEHWDANPALAYVQSAREGWNAGGAQWLSDQSELFTAELWTDLGSKVREAAGTAIDRLASYSRGQYQSVEKEINKHLENPDDTLLNWAWWQRSLTDTAEKLRDEQLRILNSVGHNVAETASSVLETADKARKIYRHREAILNLPTLIANGDPKPVQKFIDTVLMDIDPQLAKAIRNDPHFAAVLELIADHDSALTYLSYVGLMIEAVPPNFFAYVAGKGGAYLMIEVVMLVVTALLSAGTAAAARVTMLVARFAAAGAKAVTANRHIKRAKVAIEAFIRILKDLSEAADELHDLGLKLIQARSRGLNVRGNTRTTLQARRSAIKRDKKCRLCGSTKHSTPRVRPGEIEYS